MGRKRTAQDVAAAAGVSPATVDRVLNGRGGVAEAKERAVLAAARRLGLDRALDHRPARTLRIAVLAQPPTNPFHAEICRGFDAATRSHAAFNLQFLIHHIDPERPAETAARIARLPPHHDGLVIMAAHEPQIATALDAFAATGRPVIALATDIGAGAHRYIGPDNLRAGRMAGALMARLLGPGGGQGGGLGGGLGGGEVLVIAGLLAMTGQAERVEGFRAALSLYQPAATIVRIAESHERADLAGDLVFDTLRRNPGLRGIYNASAGAATIVEALQRQGRQHDVVFITHELTEDRRRLLRAGLIDAVLDQDPQQEVRVTVETLAAHFGRSAAPPASLITPVQIHMIENA